MDLAKRHFEGCPKRPLKCASCHTECQGLSTMERHKESCVPLLKERLMASEIKCKSLEEEVRALKAQLEANRASREEEKKPK